MRPAIKAKWIKALISGKYRQGKNALKRGTRFCCLGVLCDIYLKTHRGSRWDEGCFYPTKDSDFGSDVALLPEPVMNWAGMSSDNGVYMESQSLLADNDGGKSFDAIASIIKKEF